MQFANQALKSEDRNRPGSPEKAVNIFMNNPIEWREEEIDCV